MKDSLYSPLPVFHSYGLTIGLILPIVACVDFLLARSPLRYKENVEFIKENKPTVTISTSTFLAGLAKYATKEDFSSLRLVFAGAEKVQQQVIDYYSNVLETKVYEGYGATEFSPLISVNSDEANRVGSVGKMMKWIEYKIEKFDGYNEENSGLLYLKGPNQMIGYYKNYIEGKTSFEDGWYNTGDVIKIDEEGFVFIIGRAKRFIKIAGEMVSLNSIESIISQFSPNHHHAAISMKDKNSDIAVLCTTDNTINKKEIISLYKSSGYSNLFLPQEVLHVDDIPMYASGKINYIELEMNIKNSK